jgi:hypothetical protein
MEKLILAASATLFGSVIALVGGFAVYDHLPRKGKLHEWQHKHRWGLGGLIKRYRAVDGSTPLGLFCADCAEWIPHEGEVAPVPWPATMPAFEAETLFFHAEYNANTWGSKLSNEARLKFSRADPGFDDRVRAKMFAYGYTAEDLAKSYVQQSYEFNGHNYPDMEQIGMIAAAHTAMANQR